MNFALLESPLFWAGQHYVSTLGLIAFAGLFREAGIEIPFPQRDVHIRSSHLQGAAPPSSDGVLQTDSRA